MSTFPNFSNIQGFVQKTLTSRKGNTELISKLNPFVRIVSGVNGGLVMVSNPDWKLLQATGTTYGSSTTAGAIGTTWGGTPINPNSGQGYRPSPIVTSLEVDEAQGGLSRKATFSVTCFTKEQMEKLTGYILSPGFSILIEWGWGAGGYGGLRPLDASTISELQSGPNLNKIRQDTGGNYDAYLGFITGGGVSIDGDKWTINVKCTGYTELPSYLLNTETGTSKGGASAGVACAGELFGKKFIETNVTTSQNSGSPEINFMRMYNELPKSRQTAAVRNLLKDPLVTNKESFINFDDEVSEKVSETTSGKWFGFAKSKVKVGGKTVAFPIGTKICGPDKFIRFDAAMRIMYQIGIKGYKLPNGKTVTFKVDYEDTLCSAFEKIFSTDGSKLFIPNPKTPHFNLSAPKAGALVDTLYGPKDSNNQIGSIVFPQQGATTIQLKDGSLPITKGAYEAGYLKNLYINFDFFKSVLDTPNFYLKDSLYQLLNGMSSAVNGMWDFQIDENYVEEAGTNCLKIWEMNLVSNQVKKSSPYTFNMIGEKSVFIDASLDLDVSGAKMNQIIGIKSAKAVNESATSVGKGIWGQDIDSDKLKVTLVDNPAAGCDDKVGSTQTAKDAEELAEENLAIILDKVRYYPKVWLKTQTPFPDDLFDMCYMGAYNDTAIFNAFLNKKKQIDSPEETTPLMPINFTFKVHGVSGIRRGDMFKVDGAPSIYVKDGFFQVLSVKHVVDGMQWTTEVTGGYRNNK